MATIIKVDPDLEENAPPTLEGTENLVYVRRGEGGYGGWKVELLVDKLASKMEEKFSICCHCNGLLRDACLVDRGEKQELRCSMCVPSSGDSQAALLNRESVNEKAVRCPLKTQGCDWSDPISELLDHIGSCSYISVLCPLRCKLENEFNFVERRLLEEHLKSECDMRLISCEFCNNEIKASYMNAHILECGDFPVVCPNVCSSTGKVANPLKRRSLDAHLDTECPLQDVECPYSDFGCGVVKKRRLMDDHEKESIHTHFKLSMAGMAKMHKEQAEKIESLEQEIEEKDQSVRELKDDLNVAFSVLNNLSIGSLDWNVTGVKDKINHKTACHSDPFYLGLYKFQGYIEWDCQVKSYLGIFLYSMKGNWDHKLKWPFRYKMKFILINQNDATDKYTKLYEISQNDIQVYSDAFRKPTNTRNMTCFGIPKFITHKLLEEKYLKNDSVSFQIIVERSY